MSGVFMFGSSGRLLIALSLAVPSIVTAQTFQYAPSTNQYRITTTQKGAQEAMGQKQEFQASNNQLLSVTVAPQSRDTLAVTIRIDSINIVGPMGAPPGIEK